MPLGVKPSQKTQQSTGQKLQATTFRQALIAQGLHAHHKGGQSQANEHKTDEIERSFTLLTLVGDVFFNEPQSHQPERHIQVKNVVPRKVSGDETSQGRSHNRRHETRPSDEGHHLDQLVLGRDSEHNESPHRHHHGAPHALKDSGHGEGVHGFAERAAD